LQFLQFWKLQLLWSLTMKAIKIGTRGSVLALWQAGWVRSRLQDMHPGLEVEIVKIKTTGDKILDVPLAQVGGKGLFVKEIETALLENGVDLAVHSMKDVPAEFPGGLCIGAVPQRENPLDVLISRNGEEFAHLPKGARIGSSSLRRAAQVRHARPDITVHSLRGNLDTRLKKLRTENLDAILLAAAGVRRLGLEARITQYLPVSLMLPAIGQGALAIEIRQDDEAVRDLVAPMDDRLTRVAVDAERAFLARLEGGCQVPIAGQAKVIADTLELTGLIAEIDGSVVYRETKTASVDKRVGLGHELADSLLDQGGREILNRVYGKTVQDLKG
jgi:hydroxymethylbilane synthase